MAFLGRNCRMIDENRHECIHIIMERVTNKTMDCYVEFVNMTEAMNAVTRYEGNRMENKGGRLGNRHVEMELSSMDHLLKDLFPKAKNVKWENGRAHVIPRDPNDPYNSGFQGFLSKEELIMLGKHAAEPRRVSSSHRIFRSSANRDRLNLQRNALSVLSSA
jgi:hypothetical protein